MAVRARVLVTVVMAACGAPAKPAIQPAPARPASAALAPTQPGGARAAPTPRTSSVERFVNALQTNQSLYGVGRDCDEWRAGPDERAHERRDDTLVDGRIAAALPDEGRMYRFTYSLKRAAQGLRMTIMGRGSWSPAPGVTFEVEDKPGWVTIGSGTYCLARVDVRPHPDHEDAVLVGGETWYLTREACQLAHSRLANAVLSCSDMPRK